MMFPDLDPIAFSVGPLAVRWYALAYIAGLIGGWRGCMAMARRKESGVRAEHFDQFLSWAVVGIILGGRIGYVLFYNFPGYAGDPLEAFKIWHGGMSFHGGMIGVIAAAYFFAREKKISFFAFTDLLAVVTPIGLGLGRLANFVNGELFGRQTDVPWGVVFPRGGDVARHPSQLYEAVLEGAVLLLLMYLLWRRPKLRARRGFLSGAFLTMYAIMRFGAEFFREPDPQLGFLFAGATMGQWLCLPMVLAGMVILAWSMRRSAHERA